MQRKPNTDAKSKDNKNKTLFLSFLQGLWLKYKLTMTNDADNGWLRHFSADEFCECDRQAPIFPFPFTLFYFFASLTIYHTFIFTEIYPQSVHNTAKYFTGLPCMAKIFILTPKIYDCCQNM